MIEAARRRSVGQYLAWLIPFFALNLGDRIAGGHSTGRTSAEAALVGAVAGAAWQLVYRRDLADRLTFFASLIAIWLIFGAALNVRLSIWSSKGTEFAALGVLVALVFTEQWQRMRTRHSAARQAPMAGATSRQSET